MGRKMSLAYDKRKQIRLEPKVQEQLEKALPKFKVKTSMPALANAAILIGLPSLVKMTK